MDVDLNRVGGFKTLRVVAVEAANDDVLSPRLVAQSFDHLIGLRFGGVLHLNLQYEVAATTQIETEVNIVLEIRFELIDRPGKSDDAENADEHGRHNHNRFDHQVPLH